MSDRQKVINGLEEAKEFIRTRSNGSASKICRLMDVCNAAVILLKEQEPIEPVDDGHGSLICGNQGYECGCVGRYDLTTKVVEKYCNFCPECGKKVKWDG